MASKSHHSLLVIDNDPVMLLCMCLLLEKEGYKCREALSANDGLTALRRQRPDAVICDVHLVGSGGIDFLKAVRAEPRWVDLPIAIFTGAVELAPHMVAEVARMGASVTTGVVSRCSLLQLVNELLRPDRPCSGSPLAGRARENAVDG